MEAMQAERAEEEQGRRQPGDADKAALRETRGHRFEQGRNDAEDGAASAAGRDTQGTQGAQIIITILIVVIICGQYKKKYFVTYFKLLMTLVGNCSCQTINRFSFVSDI